MVSKDLPSFFNNLWDSKWESIHQLNIILILIRNLLTWLILPVVICLFRRLSHASLSISLRTKLRIAHYNTYKNCGVIHTDTYGKSVDNTWVFPRGRSWQHLYWWASWFRVSLMRESAFICDLSALSVRYWLTEAVTGNGELGFDSGEGAWETATTSKGGSRRANYPIPTWRGSEQK